MTSSSQEPRRRVAILGATGSVGTQALDVCRQHADRLEVVALSADSSAKKLMSFAHAFGVSHLALANPEAAYDPALADIPEGATIGFGAEALVELACLPEVDVVVNAVVGFAGIHVGMAALQAGKTLAYANKESIVCGGDLIMPLVTNNNLLPVDSEHSALFQCLVGEDPRDVSTLWLTCSGGPFFGRSRAELAQVTAQEALAHPTWKMGPKITIDSATLMNKGLEVIEAERLFSQPENRIKVTIHRQSKIHSMVEFIDGSVKAQLGASDMRVPIQYALSWPRRWPSDTEKIEWGSADPLTFATPDEEAFGCLALAREAGRVLRSLPCVLNAANEVANAAFRTGAIGFLDIEDVVAFVCNAIPVETIESIDQLVELDARARLCAQQRISTKDRHA